MSAVPENRHSMADRVRRVRALDDAGDLIGKALLADRMGVPVRTLRSYASVERRLPAPILAQAAIALETRAAEIAAHAARLRALAQEAVG